MARLAKNRSLSVNLPVEGILANEVCPVDSASTKADASEALASAVIRLNTFQAEMAMIKAGDKDLTVEFSLGGSYNSGSGAVTGDTSQGKVIIAANTEKIIYTAFENLKLSCDAIGAQKNIHVFVSEKAY